MLGWPPNVVFAMMCGAGVLCCIPMAMPQGHLVAFCSDLGISRSMSAVMLSILLGTAFLSRQIWGLISDRIGGLATVLIGSACQAASMTAFLLTQNETGLFTVSAAFGLGSPASFRPTCWRARTVPGLGSFLADPDPAAVQRQWHGRRQLARRAALRPLRLYAPAFAAGMGANIVNLLILGVLVGRTRQRTICDVCGQPLKRPGTGFWNSGGCSH